VTELRALPTLVTSVEELDDARDRLRVAGMSVVVVMTMGALHEGHAELIRTARELADAVIVTIFVNPLQFGPTEDLDRYPRTLTADVDLCSREGVDVVFAPTAEVIYPDVQHIRITAGAMGERLCGRSRPGHFDGVLTVVAKLLHLTNPDVAVFGEKDAQQLALIKRMVQELEFPVEVVGVPTVREADGLALSSRNAYLSAAERASALAISRALRAAEHAAPRGPDAVLSAAREVLQGEAGLRLDYLELVDPGTLEPVTSTGGDALLAVAAFAGTTRLIDNVVVDVGAADEARTHKEP
jgi:pantoate--beta-alanine ligase